MGWEHGNRRNRAGVDSFQDEDLVMAKARRRTEDGLIMTLRQGFLRRPGVNVHMAGQAILRQAQERVCAPVVGKLSQRERSAELILMAFHACEAVVSS